MTYSVQRSRNDLIFVHTSLTHLHRECTIGNHKHMLLLTIEISIEKIHLSWKNMRTAVGNGCFSKTGSDNEKPHFYFFGLPVQSCPEVLRLSLTVDNQLMLYLNMYVYNSSQNQNNESNRYLHFNRCRAGLP